MKIPEILLVETAHKPGTLARVLDAVGRAGVLVENVSAVRRDEARTVWEITLEFDEAIDEGLVERIEALADVRIAGKSDRVFNRHRGGKIRTVSRCAIESVQQLRDVYTPGVARVCLAIRDDPALADEYTGLRSTVAIVTNGTAILGLGNVGPLAGLPVMEGKAALFHQLADLSGVPILVDESDPARIVDVVTAIALSFGAIQLEDIAAPACFAVEEGLRERLDRPVLHDDQHGTAVVVLAALLSARERVGLRLRSAVVGQIGLGAAGIGIGRLLHFRGVESLLGTDPNREAVQRFEALGGVASDQATIMAESDVVIATTGVRGLIDPGSVRPGQVILALTNPDPEITPAAAREAGAAFAADGRAVNNVLGFPGLFRGALDAGATRFTRKMLVAAAETLARLSPEGQLVPDPLDRGVHRKVAEAVAGAARP